MKTAIIFEQKLEELTGHQANAIALMVEAFNNPVLKFGIDVEEAINCEFCINSK